MLEKSRNARKSRTKIAGMTPKEYSSYLDVLNRILLKHDVPIGDIRPTILDHVPEIQLTSRIPKNELLSAVVDFKGTSRSRSIQPDGRLKLTNPRWNRDSALEMENLLGRKLSPHHWQKIRAKGLDNLVQSPTKVARRWHHTPGGWKRSSTPK